jgi:hypothetical protein
MALQVSETEPSHQADESGPHNLVRAPLQYKPPTQAHVSQMNSSIEVLIQKFFYAFIPCELALCQLNKSIV